MTVHDLIALLLDLEDQGYAACPIKVQTPRRLVNLLAEDMTVCTDETPPSVRLEVRMAAEEGPGTHSGSPREIDAERVQCHSQSTTPERG